ncbi:hypothetical protein [Nocardia sp. NPDC050793]|uniref:hypothetical protein n=1 Tax=Nocardia sp. NPDC050793 TaxID=3155159 RepID=UPI0033DA459E
MTVDDALSLLVEEDPTAWSQMEDGSWRVVFADGRMSDPLPDHIAEALRITVFMPIEGR